MNLAEDTLSDRPAYAYTGDLADDTTAALQMLVVGSGGGSGPRRVFARGGKLVEVAKVDAESVAIRGLSAERCADLLAHSARWVRVRATKTGEIADPIPVPRHIPGTLLARSHWPGLPELSTVVSHPWMRCDGAGAGELVASPGYDGSSRTWGAWRPSMGRQVARHLEELSPGDALAVLDDILWDFPFADGRGGPHHAAALAAWLTAAARPGIAGNVPMWLVEASTRGSGKGKLCDAVLLSVYPTPTSRTQWPAQDEEVDKRMTAYALAGVDRVLIDNVVGLLGGPSLDAAVTAAEAGYQGRVLGVSQVVSLPFRPFWLANGNNVRIKGDLDRRVLVTRLDPGVPNPEARTGFRHASLERVVRERRPLLLAAALRLVRHGVEVGGPTLGSFETWSRIVRGALLDLGMPDPWDSGAAIREAHADDTHTAVVWAWAQAFGSDALTVRDLIGEVDPAPVQSTHRDTLLGLREDLIEVAADRKGKAAISSRRLGQWLSRHRDRVVVCPDGRQRRLAGQRVQGRGVRWVVEEVA